MLTWFKPFDLLRQRNTQPTGIFDMYLNFSVTIQSNIDHNVYEVGQKSSSLLISQGREILQSNIGRNIQQVGQKSKSGPINQQLLENSNLECIV